MSRGRRALLVGGGLFVAVVLVVVVTFVVLLRPAALEARIEREVHDATGLVLHIDGGVRWRAWPEPKLTLGAARVEAPAGGGAAAGGAGGAATPLLQWRVLAAEAQWSPLLHGEAKLVSLTLDGVALTLVRGADGAIGWPKIAPASAPGGGGAAGAGPARAISIGRLAVRNAVVRVVGEGVGGAPGATLAVLDGLAFQAGIDYESAGGTLRLVQPAALAVAHGGTLQPEGLRVALDAGAITLGESPLRFETKLVHAWIDRLEAVVRFEGAVDPATPAGAGELSLAVPSLRDFAAALGAALPPTRDPTVFGPLELQAGWHASATGTRFDPLKLTLDGGAYLGSASVPAGGPAAGHPVRFALKGGTLDLRRYLRPPEEPGEPFTLPVEWLRAQHVEGVLQLEQAHAVVGVLHGVKVSVLDQAE